MDAKSHRRSTTTMKPITLLAWLLLALRCPPVHGRLAPLEIEPNDAFKQNPDWWKDPLALFEDDNANRNQQASPPKTKATPPKTAKPGNLSLRTTPPVKPSTRTSIRLPAKTSIKPPVKPQSVAPEPPLQQETEPSAVIPAPAHSSLTTKSNKPLATLFQSVSNDPWKKALFVLALAAPFMRLVHSRVQSRLANNPAKLKRPFAFLRKINKLKTSLESTGQTVDKSDATPPVETTTNEPDQPAREVSHDNDSIIDLDEDEIDNYYLRDEDATIDSVTYQVEETVTTTTTPSNVQVDIDHYENQIAQLQQDCKQAELDKQRVEREYEKTSMQLQETAAALASLQSTTKYLQAQLKDSEGALERAVRAERSKAKKDLVRIKEAMIKVRNYDRVCMSVQNCLFVGSIHCLVYLIFVSLLTFCWCR
jgi:hypothetical protein